MKGTVEFTLKDPLLSPADENLCELEGSLTNI